LAILVAAGLALLACMPSAQAAETTPPRKHARGQGRSGSLIIAVQSVENYMEL
jgi:hypothetical protein